MGPEAKVFPFFPHEIFLSEISATLQDESVGAGEKFQKQIII